LFLRIFLWFWAAMAVVVAVLVVSSPFFTRSRPGLERWQHDAEQMLARRVEAYARWVADGEGGSFEGFPGRHRRMPLEFFVFDGDGREIRDRSHDRDVEKLARRAFESDEELSERSGSLHLMARPVVADDGSRLVVVGALRRPPRPTDLLEPRILIPRLASLGLIVGLLCLWLARHLSSPVASLRKAARHLSDGDLTARVGPPVSRRRDELGDLARDFDGMAERLEALVDSQRRLLRDVSHELRSPLARLEVALELARNKAGEAAERPLDRIEREAHRLDSLIEQLLALDRLESGQMTPASEDVNLGALLEEVAADARYEARRAGRKVELQAEPGVRISGSTDLLRSAFENVVRNAVAYTRDGTTVEVECRLEPAEEPVAVIEVRDRGPGVSEKDLEHLFEPFYRVAEARDRQSGGIGLGLAITARAVRLHGGTIAARNRPDGGLEVTVRLPVGSSDPTW
jgi:two-component system sensor histidine kinase CpxA